MILGLILVWWRWIVVDTGQIPPPNVETTEVAVVEEVDADLQEGFSEPEVDVDKEPGTEALEQFKRNTRYPATTRLIDENSHDLLNPGARHEKRHKLPGNKNNPEMDWQVLYTADRFFVRGKEPLLVSLQLWNKGEAVPPSQVEMVAHTVTASNGISPVRLVTRVDGAARTAVLTANDHWPDYVGQIRVTTDFSAEGLEKQSGSLDFYFTAENRIPAVFTGEVSDRLSDGDLLIDVGVDVKTAGFFRIDGNLFDSTGLPFGWARFEGELPDGLAMVDLRFHGLLFHDAQAVGPFTLKNLHGSRLRPGDTPHKEDMPEPGSDYVTTGFYELGRFRTDVNNSPRRQKMIKMYEDAIRRGVKLTAPAYEEDG